MNNYATMQASFEQQKNIKASLYTLTICTILFIVFFFLQWTLPQIPKPIIDEGIEVNLGNSETGSEDVAPQLPGQPSAKDETNVEPPATTTATQTNNVNADENNTDPDAPVVNKTTKPAVKNNPTPETKHNKPNTTVTAVVPKPAKPKAVYKGGTENGNGGNNADSYNGVKNQGVAGGKGDQGSPNGNPNSDSYKGNASSGNGVTIRSGLNGRKLVKLPSFEDDFNENAKVAVDITVNKDGTVSMATINPRGTTTTSQSIRAIALRKARLLKLNASTDDEQTGTIVFNFKVTN